MSDIKADAFYPIGSSLCKSALAVQQEKLKMKAKQTNNITSTPTCHGLGEAKDKFFSTCDATNTTEISLFYNIDEELPLDQQFAQLLGISMHNVHISNSYTILKGITSQHILLESTDCQLEERCNEFLRRIGII